MLKICKLFINIHLTKANGRRQKKVVLLDGGGGEGVRGPTKTFGLKGTTFCAPSIQKYNFFLAPFPQLLLNVY